MNFEPLSEQEEKIAKKIVDAAYTVHNRKWRNIVDPMEDIEEATEIINILMSIIGKLG